MSDFLLGLFVFGVQAAVVVMIVSVIVATPFVLVLVYL